ncbi:hypothetical protein EDC04DRAFT_2899166 [Pisolithus marmoratus]|nr:hypothetical protein EDC04DRAFT_2899166 [Pisolithus marmoratus]
MVHHIIISGLPDSILMLCMHLDTPHETFTYLKNHYGRIPRLESQMVVEEAVQEHDLPSEQYATEESALSTCDSDNEPLDAPSMEEDPPDFPNDCAEITDGHEEPEAEIIDAWQVENHLLVVEVGNTDAERPDECVHTLEASDKGQHADDEAAAHWNLPEWSAEAPEPADEPTKQSCGYSIEFVPKTHLEQDQSLLMSSETIANVPDPPHCRIKRPILQDTLSAQTRSATTMELKFPCTRRYNEPQQRGQLPIQSHSLAPLTELPYWSAWPPNCSTKRNMGPMADRKGQHTEREVKWPNNISVPLEPPRTSIMHIGRTFMVAHRGEAVRTRAEVISNLCTRQNAYCTLAAPMRPPLSLFAPTKPLIYLVGGSWTVKVDYSKVSSARGVKTRGHTYWIAGIPMQLLQMLSNVSNRLRNIANPYWREGASPVSMRSDAKRPRNLPVAKQLPHSSSRRQGNTCTGMYSPVPPKRPPNGLIHTPSTSMDLHRDGRIKMRAEIVSNIRMRRSTVKIDG